jgi:hypothetical protein
MAKLTASRSIETVSKVLSRHRAALEKIPGVVRVRPGYDITPKGITDEGVIVVKVAVPGVSGEQTADLSRIPASIGDVPVRVAPATPEDARRSRRERGVEAGPESAGAESVAEAPVAELLLPGDPQPEPGGEAAVVEARTPYEPPQGVTLDEVSEPMRVTLHASPDAGWPTLSGFIAGVRRSFTIGMYDLTAPHIVAGLIAAMKSASGDLRLVLDPKIALEGDTKKDDLEEDVVERRVRKAIGGRFKFDWAAVRVRGKTTGSIFKTAYHIKVAVRDGRAFWLSSGNWQSSNQPDADPFDGDSEAGLHRDYNREWHVIVENATLARMYEAFIKHDQKQAAPFQELGEGAVVLEAPAPRVEIAAEELEARGAPRFFVPVVVDRAVRVQPLLTPDNYQPEVLKLIRSARKTLYFQNQYIKITKSPDERFLELVDAVSKKASDGVDVRVILRDGFGSGDMLEALKTYGFDMTLVRVQRNCHNKGLIVDERAVMCGSHNWSNDGTLDNRDASLIFHDPEIAAYYQTIFLHDWDRLARPAPSTDEAVIAALRNTEEGRTPRVTNEAWTEMLVD